MCKDDPPQKTAFGAIAASFSTETAQQSAHSSPGDCSARSLRIFETLRPLKARKLS